MPVFEGSLLNALIGVTATFLGLAVLVQIVQEIYKFLTSSKYRLYTKVLVDFLGPWSAQLLRPGPILDLQVSGPFQIKRLTPKGILLPMNQESLANALERTSPYWIGKTVDQLKLECELQGNMKTRPSPEWILFLKEIGEAERGAPGYWNAYDIVQFLSAWGHNLVQSKDGKAIGEISVPTEINAIDILTAFRKKFLPHVESVDRDFPQLERNFEYSYRRRNLRQTFMIAITIAILFNLPFERIYLAASKASPEDTIAAAEKAIDFYERQSGEFSREDSIDAGQQIALARGILEESMASLSKPRNTVDYFVSQRNVFGLSGNSLVSLLRYIFGCILTAFLVSFGAPFWNDILGLIMNIKRGKQPGENAKGER